MPRNDSTDASATLGAQAMEFALSSTQQFTDSADRLVRAIADSSLVRDSEVSGASGQPEEPAILGPWRLARQLQRSSFEWGLNAWVAWARALGSLASASVGQGMGLLTAEPPGQASVLGSPAWATPRPAASAERRSSIKSSASRASNAAERAVAASGAKRRRPAAKPSTTKRPRKKS